MLGWSFETGGGGAGHAKLCCTGLVALHCLAGVVALVCSAPGCDTALLAGVVKLHPFFLANDMALHCWSGDATLH